MCHWSRVKGKLLCRVLSSTGLFVLITLIVSTAVIFGVTPDWLDNTDVQLIGTEKSNLVQLASSKASLIDNAFDWVHSDLNVLAAVTRSLIAGTLTTATLPSYSALSSFSPNFTGASSQYGFWYLTDAFAPDSALIAPAQAQIDLTSNLDVIFRSLYGTPATDTPRTGDWYVGIYVAFESNGLIRYFPYLNRDFYQNYTYTCVTDNSTRTGYDPRCRSWYQDAKTNGGITYSGPFSSNGVMTMTISLPVYDAANTLIGVIAADVTMATIETNIRSTSISSLGYAYLFSATTSRVIVHPSLTSGAGQSASITSLELPSQIESEVTSYSSMITTIIGDTNGNGSTTITKSGSLWYVGYAASVQPSLRVVVLVPESAITSSSMNVTDSIYKHMLGQILGFLLLLCALGLFAWALINYFGSRFLPPINNMIRASLHMRDGILIDNISDPMKPPGQDDINDSCVEMTSLHSAFQACIMSLRVGNPTYAGSSPNLVMDTYEQALTMYTLRNDLEGMLYVHTEMANYSLKCGDMAGAWDAYISCIEIAEQLEDKARKEDEQKKWKNIRSLRLASKALLLGVKATQATSADQQNGCLNEKEVMLLEALSLDRETDNGVSFALHAGYLGQLYLQTNRNDDARRIFSESMMLAQKPHLITAVFTQSDVDVMQQLADVNMGVWMRSCHDYTSATRYFCHALENFGVLDKHVQRVALTNLEAIYRICGEKLIADDIRRFLAPRDVAFCIDSSDTMNGIKYETAIRSFKMLFEDRVTNLDSVSWRMFNSEVVKVFGLQPKGPNYEAMRDRLNTLPATSGRTALYDAISDALDELDVSPNRQYSQWLIVLTDGDDTDSRTCASKEALVQRLARSSLTALVVIAVGADVVNAPWLESLCKNTKHGLFRHVATGRDVMERAFADVAHVMLPTGSLDEL